jgi:Uma2 family endonuclease
MKVVIPEVPTFVLDWRRRTGADRWDEMWEGVLHMPPAPSLAHQDFESDIEGWLRTYWAPGRGRVYRNVNVAAEGNWPHDYRIPDLVLLARERFGIRRDEYLDGAPDVVIEIESPGDETREKLSFYARIGVPEVWIFDRDTRAPEIHVLRGGQYEPAASGAEHWLLSSATGVQVRQGPHNRLAIQMGDHSTTRALLPEE